MSTSPKLFVHGLKGGHLVTAAGGRRWCGSVQVLGLGASIALPLVWNGERQAEDGLRPAGPIDGVTVVPRLVTRAMYGPWLAFGRRRWGAAWHEFAYDWRRDNHETRERLGAEIRALADAHGAPVDVIAHSMGGTLTLAHLLADGDEHVGRVVFAGVPFSGGVGYLGDMHEGAWTGLDRRLLSPAAQFSFPSVYTFFPLSDAKLVDRRGERLGIDLFDPEAWVRARLGIFADEAADTPANRAFLARALAAAAGFRTLLDGGATAPRMRVRALVVSGHGRPTRSQVIRDGPRAVRGWDSVSAPTVDGDGRVRTGATLPPPAIAYQQVRTTVEHGDLLNDPTVQAAIAEFLA